MEDNELCNMDRLISQTAELHCFDDPIELEYCNDEIDASVQVLAAAKILSIKPHSVNFGSSADVGEINFSSTQFWVRIMGLSRDSISEPNIRLIAAKIGRLVEIDPKSLGIFFVGDFVRVKIDALIHKPLAAGFFQKRKRGAPRWIQLKYERLHDFCFKCGVLGHDHRICSATERVTVSNGITRVALYGAWLRAENDILSCFHSIRSNMEKRQADYPEPNRAQELPLISRNRQAAGRERIAPNDWRLENKNVIPSPSASQMVQVVSSRLGDQRRLYVTSSSLESDANLRYQGKRYTNEEIMETEVQVVEHMSPGQSFAEFCREKRGKVVKYAGLFPDVLIDLCYHPEEYYNDILEEMLEPSPVIRFKAHQAILNPAPSMEEWRAQQGIGLDGARISPSRKRKVQEFILPIPYPTDMPQ
ncbi:Zinc knuckle CX2CX4HX4C [Parasponia andersonii]|uniref:Zinc knuckle CX2CX4HX4C n=1 Tax=Parasponia andersonii TaxID=3476 RepID=A0A2P5D5L7_PARAD|nr:Zinc knuckle CX2CX4HX4C [Parasponia andersonii]